MIVIADEPFLCRYEFVEKNADGTGEVLFICGRLAVRAGKAQGVEKTRIMFLEGILKPVDVGEGQHEPGGKFHQGESPGNHAPRRVPERGREGAGLEKGAGIR